VRILGEAVLDSDTWVPQIAAGLLYKKTTMKILLKAPSLVQKVIMEQIFT